MPAVLVYSSQDLKGREKERESEREESDRNDKESEESDRNDIRKLQIKRYGVAIDKTDSFSPKADLEFSSPLTSSVASADSFTNAQSAAGPEPVP